nr:hypothetical protein [Tanacetum cinerariifolium]
MNQNFYNSNSSGFDQTQPPQFPVIHPPPQETSIEILHDQEKNCPAFYNNGDDDDVDYTIAIIPVLSTEELVDSLSMGDEHLDTIPATKSGEVIKSSVEDLVPTPSESEEVAEIVILEDEEIEDENLREKLLNVHLLIANIEALKDNPTPSSELLTRSSSTSPKSFLEETNTFHNSLPEFENFCFDLEEISSGRVTLLMRSSLINSLTSYLHRSMIVSTLGNCMIRDCPDCEVSRALSFCLSFTRASHPQLHFGNPVSKSY